MPHSAACLWPGKTGIKRTEEWALTPAKKKELRLEKWL